jgi:tetratricopeptide (TPR) repeat protein
VQIGRVVTKTQPNASGLPQAPQAPTPWTRREWACAALLVLAVLAAYHPVWHAGFVWDDDAHLMRPDMRSLHGLWRIWADPSATQQYYPVLYSAFWIEHRLWGDAATWYHLANIALHCAVACLFFRFLTRISVPGAFLGAALFALHPVNVETVAWVSEQKNTLSAVFYFASALAYLRFDSGRVPRWHAAALLMFFVALLSKSVTATLPAALLVILWWKRGSISPKRDIAPLLPFFVLGASMGAVTAYLERTHVGASGAAFELSPAARILVAGRALWFYLGKIAWPSGLTFIYPRWTIDPSSAVQWLFPAGGLVLVFLFWLQRNRTRSPLAIALLFAGTLFPALGFVNLFPFLYSYVADHFQYLAMAAVVAGVSAAATLGTRRLGPAPLSLARVGCGLVVAALGLMTWRQCHAYEDTETLWRATISNNPESWMAYNNLAVEYLKDGRLDEAAADVAAGLRLNPDNPAAHATLGETLDRQGHPDRALAEFNRALELDPYNAAAHTNLADTLEQLGRTDEAMAHFNAALEVAPESAKAMSGLGEAYLRRGNMDLAIAELGRSLAADPGDASVHANLGTALMMKDHVDQATVQYEVAVGLDPRLLVAQYNLGNALIQSGNFKAASDHLMAALAISPRFGPADTSLGYALLKLGRTDEALAYLRQALEIDPKDARAKGYLLGAGVR